MFKISIKPQVSVANDLCVMQLGFQPEGTCSQCTLSEPPLSEPLTGRRRCVAWRPASKPESRSMVYGTLHPIRAPVRGSIKIPVIVLWA